MKFKNYIKKAKKEKTVTDETTQIMLDVNAKMNELAALLAKLNKAYIITISDEANTVRNMGGNAGLLMISLELAKKDILDKLTTPNEA